MKLYNYIIDKVGRFIMLAPFMCLLVFFSCRTKYVPVESKADSVVVEKLVEVQLPPDSATIRALLECDENGKVVLAWLDIANSRNAQAHLTIDSLGNLLAKMKTQQDTVYLPSKKITVTKEVKVPYSVEKELTRWQKLCINVGGWAIGIVIITILVVAWRMVYKLKK
ncbi:MAG TPA: hypothetical protein OIM59_09200 [Bacteroides mediterraneensis]|uniref:hypothetical protein n=1 Tax=Bacteroides mediterraneensis TaxID=1841856 RepID=UPI0026F071AE|nr:hypothetical protein [Bacteroides mediterraneensis]HJH64788.1 hypothetical protein [Bacteroides mediterraneensis]